MGKPRNYEEAKAQRYFGYSYVLRRPYFKRETKEIERLTMEARSQSDEDARQRMTGFDDAKPDKPKGETAKFAAADPVNSKVTEFSVDIHTGLPVDEILRAEHLLKLKKWGNYNQPTIGDLYIFGKEKAAVGDLYAFGKKEDYPRWEGGLHDIPALYSSKAATWRPRR